MVANYGHNRQGLEMLVPCASSSNFWQGIIGAVNILTAGARQCVENDCNYYFWLYNWVFSEHLITLVTQPVFYYELYRMVSSY